jgi:hypothetical protein
MKNIATLTIITSIADPDPGSVMDKNQYPGFISRIRNTGYNNQLERKKTPHIPDKKWLDC